MVGGEKEGVGGDVQLNHDKEKPVRRERVPCIRWQYKQSDKKLPNISQIWRNLDQILIQFLYLATCCKPAHRSTGARCVPEYVISTPYPYPWNPHAKTHGFTRTRVKPYEHILSTDAGRC